MITKNGQVYQLSHDEGRVIYDYANSKWVYEYDYRDIWGNLRLSFRDSLVVGKPPVITQIEDFDMLGFEIGTSQNGINNFKFQKQERLNDFGLDYDLFKYRYSDSQTGRFWQIDPLASKYPHNSVYALQENKFGRGVELEGAELKSFKALTSPKVIQHMRNATSAGKDAISVSGGGVVGGVGIDVKAGKANLALKASIAELEVTKSNTGVQSELKGINGEVMVGTKNTGIGGEINIVNVQADGKTENLRFFRVEGKGAAGSRELTSDEGTDLTLEVGMTFGAVSGKIKTNIVKVKDYVQETAAAVGAYVSEIFKTATNNSLQSTPEKKTN